MVCSTLKGGDEASEEALSADRTRVLCRSRDLDAVRSEEYWHRGQGPMRECIMLAFIVIASQIYRGSLREDLFCEGACVRTLISDDEDRRKVTV